MSDMNVTGATSTASTYTGYQDTKAKTEESAKVDETKKAEESAAVYEKSKEPEKKATYSINKMSKEDRAALVQQFKLADLFSADNLKNVSAADIAQAQKDVSEDGYWGVKQTSQRLFDFAAALAGDDVETRKEMQEAMEKGFKKAAKAWGGELPGICQDTMKAAHQLFDDYYASKGV